MENYYIPEIIISLITGVVGYFLSLAIHRYVSNRNIKSLTRRIKEAENRKELLANLAKSDRALLIKGFQYVCGLLIMIGMFFAFVLLNFASWFNQDLIYLSIILFSLLICLVGIGSIKQLDEIQNYPETVEKIDGRIAKLKRKLVERRKRDK